MNWVFPRQAMTHVNGEYEFHKAAYEIQILDKRGRVIWQKKREDTSGPIRWSGVDIEGNTVGIGDYICKVTYLDGKMVYLPFVFLK